MGRGGAPGLRVTAMEGLAPLLIPGVAGVRSKPGLTVPRIGKSGQMHGVFVNDECASDQAVGYGARISSQAYGWIVIEWRVAEAVQECNGPEAGLWRIG